MLPDSWSRARYITGSPRAGAVSSPRPFAHCVPIVSRVNGIKNRNAGWSNSKVNFAGDRERV